MANGLGGLASGLLAGARLGLDIREQQARRGREEEESLCVVVKWIFKKLKKVVR